MPKFLHPTKSGVHRLACLSLYHALLSQCSKPWLTKSKAVELREVIQTRFRIDKRTDSPGRIENSLRAGYEALNLLKSCTTGNEASIQRADALITSTRPFVQQYNEKCARLELERREKELAESRRKKRPIFSVKRFFNTTLRRPYPNVSGIRQVPRFACARGMPILRIQKPQPKLLTLAIRLKLKTRMKRIFRKERLENELMFAQDEDVWDAMVGKKEQEGGWDQAVAEEIQAVTAKLREAEAVNIELAGRMFNVVLAEQRLADKEQKEREKKQATSTPPVKRAKDTMTPRDTAK